MSAPFPTGEHADGIHIDAQFPCTHNRLWEALTSAEELSRWMGGPCVIEAREGGAVRFDLESDGVVAVGEVRACAPPRPGYRAALLEHTFVDAARPAVTSVCRWGLIDMGAQSELHFTHDGFDNRDRGSLVDAWTRRIDASIDTPQTAARQATSVDTAIARLSQARTVLLISFVGPEVPVALLNAGLTVFAKTGPEPDSWARCELRDHELHALDLTSPPDAVDLVHIDISHAFREHLEVATALEAKTLWYHSARTRPPQPADNRGCWLPATESERQRRAVENAGMTYIDDVYIADIARRITTTTPTR